MFYPADTLKRLSETHGEEPQAEQETVGGQSPTGDGTWETGIR